MDEYQMLFDFIFIYDLYKSELSEFLACALSEGHLVLSRSEDSFVLIEAFLIKIDFFLFLNQEDLLVPFTLVGRVMRIILR
jgi:hypothetical protein